MKRISTTLLAVLLLSAFVSTGFMSRKETLKVQYPGRVVDSQGICSLRPRLQERWTPIETGLLLDKGDWVRTDPRGANALRIRLGNRDEFTIGPGSLIELTDENTVRLIRGEAEISPVKKSKLVVHLPQGRQEKIRSTTILRVTENSFSKLEREPNWLKYFKGTVPHESMGSLVAKVEGRDLPLTLGYHKVTVDIRDQIARTVIEESFVNHTDSRLEGVFYFPLPQDASISRISSLAPCRQNACKRS